MKYSEAYQRTRDIDWFFRAGEHYIHVASNGGKLPDFVNDVQRLRKEQAYISTLGDVKDVEVIVRDDYLEARIRASVDEARRMNIIRDVQLLRKAYLSSFMSMARKGFYSFDRSNDDESRYILVCGPNKHVDLNLKLLDMSNEIEFDDETKTSFLVRTQYNELR